MTALTAACQLPVDLTEGLSPPLIWAALPGHFPRPLPHALIADRAACSSRLFVERPQGIHHRIEVDGTLPSRQTPPCRSRLDRTRIRCPRREDRPFFVERQIGIADDLRRVLERLGWMQKRVEIANIVEFIVGDVMIKSHGMPPSFDLNRARLGFLDLGQHERKHAVLQLGRDPVLINLARKPEASRVVADIVLGIERLKPFVF